MVPKDRNRRKRIRALSSHQSWRIGMASINTNVSALPAQRGLAKSQRQLSDTLQRLSSGLKINRGADDPAGLIASEGLRSEIAGLDQAIDNSSRASNVISTAEANLSEIASLLTNVKQLVVEAANSGALSQEEIAANQLQIDSAVASITRISNTATFAGLKLLNGSLDYITSGVAASQITALHVHQANFGTAASMPVQIDVLTSANSANAAATRAVGVDAVATINGALTVADGLNLKMNTTTLDLELSLDTAFGTGANNFTITGGGAKFQLGPQVTSNQQVSLGIQSAAASKLGDSDVGFLSDIVTGGGASLANGGASTASKIIERAIRQVAVLRGRLGAFERNTLDTNMNSLSVALENVTASESSIRDADFAAETSALTRAQILTQAGTSVLATANSTPQSVLTLLQR